MIQWPMLSFPPLNLWNFPKQNFEYRYKEIQLKNKPEIYVGVLKIHNIEVAYTYKDKI